MNKKKLFLAVLLILTLSRTNIYGQELKTENKSESDSTNTQKEIRRVFIYTSIGVREPFSFGVGYQVSPKFAVSIKYSISSTGGDYYFPASAVGMGTKISYYFPPPY